MDSEEFELCQKCNNILVDGVDKCTLCGHDRNTSYDDFDEMYDDNEWIDYDDRGEEFVAFEI